MKTTVKLLTALSICAMMFVACKPEPTPEPTPEEPTIETGLEGQFMPERKIASVKVFQVISEDSLKPYLTNTYEWNGDLLHKISQTMYDTIPVYSETFQYDSLNRVSSIQSVNDLGTNVYEFIYAGKDLIKVNQLENGELFKDFLFTKTDGKVSQISSNTYMSPVEESAQVLVWENDNIIQSSMTGSGSAVPTDFTYDNKINPLRGLFYSDFYYAPETVYSQNNDLTSVMTLSLGGMDISTTITNEYEYDGDYPVKVTSVTNTSFSSSTTISHITYLN